MLIMMFMLMMLMMMKLEQVPTFCTAKAWTLKQTSNRAARTHFPPHSEVRRTAKSRAKLPCLVLEPKVRTSSHNMHIQHTLGAHVPGFSAVPNMRAHARAHTIHARTYGTCTYNTLLARARTHTHAASTVVYNV